MRWWWSIIWQLISYKKENKINIKFLIYNSYLPSSGKSDLIQNALRR